MNPVKILWPLLLALLMGGCYSTSDKKFPTPQESELKVLLVHASQQKSVRLSISGPYHILNLKGKVLAHGPRLSPSTVALTHKGISVAGHLFTYKQIKIRSDADYHPTVNGMPYSGEIQFMEKAGKLQTLNIVPMESYLAGVIGAEMPISWPDAALHAQAIVARTYAIYERGQAEKNNKYFHVHDTVASQVYKGIRAESTRSRKIVRETHGIVMLYNNSVFKSFFHSTCGGYTADGADVFNYSPILPLSGRPCPYCKESKYYQWECFLGMADLRILLQELKLPPPFLGLSIVKKDQGQRILALKIHYGKGRSSLLSATEFRRIFNAHNKQVRSTKFVILPAENGLLVKGNGWGHGVGMCQMGAYQMACQGFTVHDIIQFYYPGVKLYRIW